MHLGMPDYLLVKIAKQPKPGKHCIDSDTDSDINTGHFICENNVDTDMTRIRKKYININIYSFVINSNFTKISKQALIMYGFVSLYPLLRTSLIIKVLKYVFIM